MMQRRRAPPFLRLPLPGKLIEFVNLCADIFTGLEADHDELAWRYTKPFGMSCSFPRPFRCCRHNLSSCQTSSVETPNQKRHVMSGQCDAPNKENPFAGLSCASGRSGEPSLLNRPRRLLTQRRIETPSREQILRRIAPIAA